MKVNLEVCAGCIESVWAAVRGGAYRVELCSGLDEGGLTPSFGFIKRAVGVPGIKKNVLIRPRSGDFLYTVEEREVMLDDIRMAKSLGVDGVVVGALTQNGNVDVEMMRDFVSAADGLDVTFHRAFDMCRDPFAAIDDIVALGCKRILTSGLAGTAEEGIDLIREMVRVVDGKLSIMPGCGVGPLNANKIAQLTGVTELHASARSKFGSKMTFRRGDVEMGKGGVDEFSRMKTSEDIVRKIVDSL